MSLEKLDWAFSPHQHLWRLRLRSKGSKGYTKGYTKDYTKGYTKGTPKIKILVRWILEGTAKWRLKWHFKWVCIKALVHPCPSVMLLQRQKYRRLRASLCSSGKTCQMQLSEMLISAFVSSSTRRLLSRSLESRLLMWHLTPVLYKALCCFPLCVLMWWTLINTQSWHRIFRWNVHHINLSSAYNPCFVY